MDKIRNAAIILLGLGDKAAGEVLKTMSPKEVRSIIDAINSIDKITEEDILRAINEFFTESNNSAGIDLSKKDKIKNSITKEASEWVSDDDSTDEETHKPNPTTNDDDVE